MYNLEEITNTILCGDAKEELKKIPDESIDMCISSPPYWALRDYQVKGQLGLESSFGEYQKKLLEIIAEVKRVLKPTGCFFLNLGDIYGGTRWSGKGVGQPINKFRDGYRDINPKRNFKPSTQGDRMYKNPEGMGKASDGSKCLSMMPERIAIAMCDQQGWILRNRICWCKQILDFKEKKTKGSVMPTSVKDRFNESWEYLYFFTKNKKYYNDLDAVRLPSQTQSWGKQTRIKEGTTGKWLKTDYLNYRVRDAKRKEGQPQFKASEKEIKRYNEIPTDYGKKKLVDIDDKKLGNRWMSGTPNFVKQRKRKTPPNKGNVVSAKEDKYAGQAAHRTADGHIPNLYENPLGKNIPTVWLIGSEPHNFKNELGVEIDHFATFPQAICEIPIKFSCLPKGIVLDPFAGSGTALLVARNLGRNYIGIELNPQYIALANKRLAQRVLI